MKNQTDMLRACVLDYKEQWDDRLSLCEFAYNSSYHSSIGMTPFEVLYGRICRTSICWEEGSVRSFHGPSIDGETSEKVKQIQEHLEATISDIKVTPTVIEENFSLKPETMCFLKCHQ